MIEVSHESRDSKGLWPLSLEAKALKEKFEEQLSETNAQNEWTK